MYCISIYRGNIMGFIKTNGVIIKEVNTGEADKVVTILTKSHGKVSGYAKGARRPKSPLVAGSQFLCYSDFVFYKGKDIYNISSCDVVEAFYEIRNDIVKLTYSAHMADIIYDVIQEEQPAGRVLQLFLNSLYMLAKTDKNPELISRIFEIRILSILGYAPYVRGCTECGSNEISNMSFSFLKCGFLCRNCSISDGGSIRIMNGTAQTLKHIVHAPIKELFNFNVSEDVLNDLYRVSKRYLKDRLEKDYTKLEFLKELGLKS